MNAKINAALLVLIICIILIGLLVQGAEAAALTEEEREQCQSQGGCKLVTVQWLQEAMTKAFAAGAEKGKGACFVSTS